MSEMIEILRQEVNQLKNEIIADDDFIKKDLSFKWEGDTNGQN